MRVEAEQRRSFGNEANRSVTSPVGSAVATSESVPDGIDWQSFSAAYFPGRRRHDLEALTAYCAYRSAQEVDAQTSDGLARIEAKRGQAGSTAIQEWEGEGGAAV